MIRVEILGVLLGEARSANMLAHMVDPQEWLHFKSKYPDLLPNGDVLELSLVTGWVRVTNYLEPGTGYHRHTIFEARCGLLDLLSEYRKCEEFDAIVCRDLTIR